jgi:rhamnosyltransferase
MSLSVWRIAVTEIENKNLRIHTLGQKALNPRRIMQGGASRSSNRPSAETICAIVVTYFPDAQFVERLNRIRGQVGLTVVVDNTGDTNVENLLGHLDGPRPEVIRNGENLGIGAALNQGLTRAKELGFKWAITFDQDSWVYPDLVAKLIAIYEKQPAPERVGMMGCNFEDVNTHETALGKREPETDFRETETVITSGCLISTAIFSLAGPFRSDFFIDYVDYEYCLRLRQLGYRIIISTEPLMLHALGAASPLSLDTGYRRVAMVLTDRSPLRRYYMTRNATYVVKRYFRTAPLWALRTLASVVVFAPLKIPFEKTERTRKMRATLRGFLDGIRSRTGKASAPWLQG